MHIHRHFVYRTNRKERKQNRKCTSQTFHLLHKQRRKMHVLYGNTKEKGNCMNYLMLHDESNAAKKRKMIRKRKTRYYTPIGVTDKERTSDKERMSEEERSRLLSVSLSGCLMWSPLYPDLSSQCGILMVTGDTSLG